MIVCSKIRPYQSCRVYFIFRVFWNTTQNLFMHLKSKHEVDTMSSSDNKLIKFWDWENGWKYTKIFEALRDIVIMLKQVIFNPERPTPLLLCSLILNKWYGMLDLLTKAGARGPY